MNITKETARRALGLRATRDSWSQCAYECELTLTSIAPYTDRRTVAVRDLCRWLERRPAEKAETDNAALHRIAAPATESTAA
jgi:hypothetical protein